MITKQVPSKAAALLVTPSADLGFLLPQLCEDSWKKLLKATVALGLGGGGNAGQTVSPQLGPLQRTTHHVANVHF